MSHLGIGLLFAFQDAAPAAEANAPNPFNQMLLMLAVVMSAFYFLIWLPESRKTKERQSLLSAIKKGDEVLTSGGIIGVVANSKDDRVTLKVDEARGVTIEFAKSAISQVLKPKGGDAAEPTAK